MSFFHHRLGSWLNVGKVFTAALIVIQLWVFSCFFGIPAPLPGNNGRLPRHHRLPAAPCPLETVLSPSFGHCSACSCPPMCGGMGDWVAQATAWLVLSGVWAAVIHLTSQSLMAWSAGELRRWVGCCSLGAGVGWCAVRGRPRPQPLPPASPSSPKSTSPSICSAYWSSSAAT